MKKSLNGTLILFGVFAALLGWYFLFEQRVRPEREKKAEDAKHLVQIERETIQEMEVDRKRAGKPGGPAAYDTYRLKKTGSDWNLTAPVEDEADSAAVGTMLATLTSTQNERTVADSPKDLEPFGLKEPAVKIRARKDSGSPWIEIKVGGDTAVGFNSYVQLDGKPAVYTASRNIKTTFDKEPSTFRNKKLLKIARTDIESAEFQVGKESFILAKSTGDDWILARTNLPADQGEVNKTLNAFIDAKIKEFVDDTGKETAKFGLAKPMATVVLSIGKEKKKVTIFVGKTGDKKNGEKFYVKHSEKTGIFEVEKDIGERLAKTGNEYRNLQIARFNRFTLTRLKVDHRKEPVELVKKGSDWEVPADASFKVDGAQVDNLLTHLQDAKAVDFVPMKSVQNDLKSPSLVIHLFEKEGDKEVEKHTLTFARRFNKVFATRTGLDMAMEIKADDYLKADMAKSDFMKKDEKAAEGGDKKTEEKKPAGKKTG